MVHTVVTVLGAHRCVAGGRATFSAATATVDVARASAMTATRAQKSLWARLIRFLLKTLRTPSILPPTMR